MRLPGHDAEPPAEAFHQIAPHGRRNPQSLKQRRNVLWGRTPFTWTRFAEPSSPAVPDNPPYEGTNICDSGAVVNKCCVPMESAFNTLDDFSGLTGSNVGGNSFTAGQFNDLSTITFRIAYDDRQSNNTNSSATRLDNFALNGTVFATVAGVPEPSSLSLVLLGMAGLLARRRR